MSTVDTQPVAAENVKDSKAGKTPRKTHSATTGIKTKRKNKKRRTGTKDPRESLGPYVIKLLHKSQFKDLGISKKAVAVLDDILTEAISELMIQAKTLVKNEVRLTDRTLQFASSLTFPREGDLQQSIGAHARQFATARVTQFQVEHQSRKKSK